MANLDAVVLEVRCALLRDRLLAVQMRLVVEVMATLMSGASARSATGPVTARRRPSRTQGRARGGYGGFRPLRRTCSWQVSEGHTRRSGENRVPTSRRSNHSASNVLNLSPIRKRRQRPRSYLRSASQIRSFVSRSRSRKAHEPHIYKRSDPMNFLGDSKRKTHRDISVPMVQSRSR
jgi:hypothetical protein